MGQNLPSDSPINRFDAASLHERDYFSSVRGEGHHQELCWRVIAHAALPAPLWRRGRALEGDGMRSCKADRAGSNAAGYCTQRGGAPEKHRNQP